MFRDLLSSVRLTCVLILLASCLWLHGGPAIATCHAQTDVAAPAVVPTEPAADEPVFEKLPPLDKSWKRLTPAGSVEALWINPKEKQVAIDAEVCLTRGYLEMFACVKNTKEHESVVALKSKAFKIDASLRALGATPGSPARWDRKTGYKPAHGPVIEVFVEWMEDGKRKRVKAQQWVRDLKTRKAMEHEWVFGGSSTFTDPETKKNYYRADGGEVICVSNFPVAMMDLPIESSDVNDELAFEAFTENIPKRGTPVRVILVPRIPSKDKKTPGTTAATIEQKKAQQTD